MLTIAAVTVICLVVLFVSCRALPGGNGTLLGLAAVISALAGLVVAFLHLLS